MTGWSANLIRRKCNACRDAPAMNPDGHMAYDCEDRCAESYELNVSTPQGMERVLAFCPCEH